jgi:hypothetical protein
MTKFVQIIFKEKKRDQYYVVFFLVIIIIIIMFIKNVQTIIYNISNFFINHDL